jgi:2-dehydropantoate 2-reductase
MTGLRITVLGGGSVGLALAATYAMAGVDVTVLARGPVLEQLRQTGITVTGVAGEFHIEPNRLKVADVAAPDPQDIGCDVLVVATKAYQAQAALLGLMQSSGVAFAPQAVLLLQNGWGSADEVRDIPPAGIAIFSSIMMIGIERRTPSHIHVNVQASPIRMGTLFGFAADAMRLAVQQGQTGFLPMVYEDNIEPAILNKFLFNSCLNALGALTGMTYGELLGNPSTRHLITHIADETIRLVQLERNLCLAASGVDYVENSLLPLVIPKGAAHRSSMFQDVEAGRRTEIDYLNGAAVRMGHARGIATPYNDVISNLIRARETGSRSG